MLARLVRSRWNADWPASICRSRGARRMATRRSTSCEKSPRPPRTLSSTKRIRLRLCAGIPGEEAVQTRYRPEQRLPRRASEGSESGVHSTLTATTVGARASPPLLTSIANDLADPKQVEAHVAARTRMRPALERPLTSHLVPRSTDHHRHSGPRARPQSGRARRRFLPSRWTLAAGDAGALQDSGGPRRAVPARTLYDGPFTAVHLATKVLQLQLQAADPAHVAALLERLNQLSDDQVLALLAQDGGPSEGRGR